MARYLPILGQVVPGAITCVHSDEMHYVLGTAAMPFACVVSYERDLAPPHDIIATRTRLV